MNVVEQIADWRAIRAQLSGSVGFVPTMGALHAGHASLVARSRAENDVTVVSIYVNPTQFDQPGDLAAYPAPLDADLALLRSLGVDYVLLPSYADIYPDGFRFRVDETQLSRELCGAHRANHFTGVLTVVLKLLNLVRPARAYFGEKDYQQFVLVRDMAAAFFLDTDIVPCPIVRESDGLALSSRNVRLDAHARRLAPELYRMLRCAPDDAAAVAALQLQGLAVDYVETRHGRRFGAVRVPTTGGSVRLIDNVEVAS
jgi:pantoate--beta-alanine ligase